MNNVIQTGTKFINFDESVSTHNGLPAGTYTIQFSPMTGFSLKRIPNLDVGVAKPYGRHEERLSRIMRTYNRLGRQLGVLLSGDKGIGKTLLVRMVTNYAINELHLPAIIVNRSYPGLAEYLDSWACEAVIVFDEFEKNFDKGYSEDGEDFQESFLGLFDGMSNQKRLYIVTVNDLYETSDFILNRPGRFHYHMMFDYPDADEIRRFLIDQSDGIISDEDIKKVVSMSIKTNLTFDHLRAIAFELSGGESFDDVIGELNIKKSQIGVSAVVNGKKGTVTTSTGINMFNDDIQSVHANEYGYIRFNVKSGSQDGDKIIVTETDNDDVSSIVITPRRGDTNSLDR